MARRAGRSGRAGRRAPAAVWRFLFDRDSFSSAGGDRGGAMISLRLRALARCPVCTAETGGRRRRWRPRRPTRCAARAATASTPFAPAAATWT